MNNFLNNNKNSHVHVFQVIWVTSIDVTSEYVGGGYNKTVIYPNLIQYHDLFGSVSDIGFGFASNNITYLTK